MEKNVARHGREGESEKMNSDAVFRARQIQDKIELRGGDVIGLRFTNSTYYSFTNLIRLVVDGVSMSSADPSVKLHYARAFSKGWHSKPYDLKANLESTEEHSEAKQFLPMRIQTKTTHNNIIPGVDLWAPVDLTNADNRLSNWYWRLDVPTDIKLGPMGKSPRGIW